MPDDELLLIENNEEEKELKDYNEYLEAVNPRHPDE